MKFGLDRYFAVLSQSIRAQSVHRVNNLATVVGALVLVVVYLSLWRAVYSEREQQASFTLAQASVYAVIALSWSYVVPAFRSTDIFEERVRSGDIVYEFVLPGSFLTRRLADDTGRSLVSILFVAIPTLTIALFAIRPDIGALRHPARIVWDLLGFLLAYVIAFSIAALIGFAALFLRRVRGLNEMRDALVILTGGAVVPLSFYPSGLQEVFVWLPFRYIYYVPVALTVGSLDVSPSDLIGGLVWAAVLIGSAIYVSRLVRFRMMLGGG